MKNTNFTIAPNELIRCEHLHPYEKLIYLYLKSRQGANEHAWPSQRRIAKELGIGLSTVKRYLDSLEDLRLIRRTSRFIGGERITSLYKVYPTTRWIREGLPRPVQTQRRSRAGYKGDSFQENSSLNSPFVMDQKKSWKNLRDDRPPTQKQMEYMRDLASRGDEWCTEQVDEFMLDIDSMSQVDANYVIETLWVDLKMADDVP